MLLQFLKINFQKKQDGENMIPTDAFKYMVKKRYSNNMIKMF